MGLPSVDNAASNEKTISTFEDQIDQLLKESIPDNTLKAYSSDWDHFNNWCKSYERVNLPASPETVAYYLTDIFSEYKVSTLERRLATISKVHKLVDEESPISNPKVAELMKALRRTKGTNKRKVKPLLSPHIKKICKNLSDKLIDVRDRSLLLLGFSGGFRRSELVGLKRSNIEKTKEGLIVTLEKSKTDQEGSGRKVGITYGSNLKTCPVRSYLTWLDTSGIEDGNLFRSITRHSKMKPSALSAQSIALIIKKRVEEIGLDAQNFSGHSLRAGFVTEAFQNGASTVAVKETTGHSTDRILQEYYRPATLFENNASALLNL
jgi:site-specific recombinase XerD